MSFPTNRMRRLRRTEALRRLVRETRVGRDDLILPLFVVEGSGVREPVASMPGVSRWSADTLLEQAKRVSDAGIPGVILFGIPADKDARGSGADAADGVVQRAVEAVKDFDSDDDPSSGPIDTWQEVFLANDTAGFNVPPQVQKIRSVHKSIYMDF